MLKLISFILLILLLTRIADAQESDKETLYFTFEEAISMALSKNNQIKASEFSMRKAEWDTKHAWTQLFPRISLNSRYSWIDDSTFALRDFRNYLPPEANLPQTVFQESYYTSIDLSMPIFNGNILNGLFIAYASENAFEQTNESTKRNVVFLVTSSYLNVLKLKKLLHLQKEYENLSQLNFEKAERLYTAGRYSKSEVLRWKVELQQQKSIVVNSESQLRSANTMLKRLININMQRLIEIENRLPQTLESESQKLASMNENEILQLISLEDDELIEVNAALAAAKSNENVSKYYYHNSFSSYMPNINLTYSHGWRENNTLDLDDYSPKTLMVNFSMPLFTSFQENFYDQLQNTRLVLTETVNKIINLKTQKELSETNVSLNENNYNVIEQQKEKGLVSNLDFIDAKLSLQNSKMEQVNTYYDYISAMVELYYLLGKLDQVID